MSDSNITYSSSQQEHKKHRNDIIRCPKCGMELIRKKLKKHNLSAHASDSKLMILSKEFTKSPTKRACAKCGVQNVDTWLFERTTRGAINLCSECKTSVMKSSFSAKAIDTRKVDALKTTLHELRQKKAKLPSNKVDIELATKIVQVDETIRRLKQPKHKWSPIFSGSFESGKRR